MLCSSGVCGPQLLSLRCRAPGATAVEPTFHNYWKLNALGLNARALQRERPLQWEACAQPESSPHSLQAGVATETQHSWKLIKKYICMYILNHTHSEDSEENTCPGKLSRFINGSCKCLQSWVGCRWSRKRKRRERDEEEEGRKRKGERGWEIGSSRKNSKTRRGEIADHTDIAQKQASELERGKRGEGENNPTCGEVDTHTERKNDLGPSWS